MTKQNLKMKAVLNNSKLALRKLNASTLDLLPLSFCWIRLQTDQACRYVHALLGFNDIGFKNFRALKSDVYLSVQF